MREQSKKWLSLLGLLLLPNAAIGQTIPIPDLEMKECRIGAANSAVKINPAYVIQKVSVPVLHKKFEDKDEFGFKLHFARYNGWIDFTVGDVVGVEHYTCTFVSEGKFDWHFNWAGIGPTK